MHQEEPLKVTELREREVAGEDCLHAFLPTDTHTDMSSWGTDRNIRNRIHTMSNCNYYPAVWFCNKYSSALVYPWSCWHHWPHPQWPEWRPACISWQAEPPGPSVEGWPCSKSPSDTYTLSSAAPAAGPSPMQRPEDERKKKGITGLKWVMTPFPFINFLFGGLNVGTFWAQPFKSI